MTILAGFVLSFFILIFGVLKGIWIGYGLILSFLIFSTISFWMNKSIKRVKDDAIMGGKRAFVVLKMFVLIGLVTASWYISGTIPSIVYYCMKLLNPQFFIIFAFLSSALVSYMLGTSTGTGSTIGVVLIVMARSGNVNLNVVGGAILAGCYVGDRASPMSSCTSLQANQTDTELYPLLKKLKKTSIIPLILTSVFYIILSFRNPLTVVGNNIMMDLQNNFEISLIVLLPAILMLVLSQFKYDVKKSMILSIILGIIVAFFIQSAALKEIITTLIWGFKLEANNPLVSILKGGGLFSMLKAGIVVFISCAMAGVLEGMNIFERVSILFKNYRTRVKLLLATAITSVATASFGGNQSIAIVMTSQIMKKIYKENKVDKYELATDISNTAVLFAPMIPWNIANLLISTTLDVNAVTIVPYAFYLYISFIVYFLKVKRKEKNN